MLFAVTRRSILIERAVEVWIPFIALAELKTGFLAGGRQPLNEGLLQAFLNLPGVGVMFPDRETSDVYARLFLHLRPQRHSDTNKRPLNCKSGRSASTHYAVAG